MAAFVLSVIVDEYQSGQVSSYFCFQLRSVSSLKSKCGVCIGHGPHRPQFTCPFCSVLFFFFFAYLVLLLLFLWVGKVKKLHGKSGR